MKSLREGLHCGWHKFVLTILISSAISAFKFRLPFGRNSFSRRTWNNYPSIGRAAENLRICVQSSIQSTTITTTAAFEMTSSLAFVDIGANLLDERFTQGVYNGKARHNPDWDQILKRAAETGVKSIILTAGTLPESRQALDLVRSLRQLNATIRFGCTIGVHPTRCAQEFVDNEMPAEEVLKQLKELALDGQADNSVVALGEIGLDYDRLQFCDVKTQQEYLEKQLQIMAHPALDRLPLFLHNRNVGTDLLDVLRRDRRRHNGVVHSFDDTLELAQQFIALGLYIGINGCSLKTKENLEVVKQLPLEKILLETDCPYCKCFEVPFTCFSLSWTHTSILR